MAASDCQAAIVLIDNSFSSINGDFIPTRIEAEKTAVEVFSRYFIRGNKESVFGFGTLADFDFGINTSLTQELRKIRLNLETIKVGGHVQLEKAIRCGLFALKHRPKEVPNRKLIILISSQHELTDEKAEILAALANKEGACIDIVVFGNDEINRETLKLFISKLGNKSFYNEIPAGTPMALADAVMQRYMANFNTAMPPESGDDLNFNDEEYQRVLAMSRQDAGVVDDVDPELQAALEESRNIIQNDAPPPQQQQQQPPQQPPQPAAENAEDINDPEFLEAMRQSMEVNDEDEIIDPDLLEAMKLSQQVLDDDDINNEGDEKDKSDNKNGEKDQQLNSDINKLIDNPDDLNAVLAEFDDVELDDNSFSNAKDDSNDKHKDKDDKDPQKK